MITLIIHSFQFQLIQSDFNDSFQRLSFSEHREREEKKKSHSINFDNLMSYAPVFGVFFIIIITINDLATACASHLFSSVIFYWSIGFSHSVSCTIHSLYYFFKYGNRTVLYTLYMSILILTANNARQAINRLAIRSI